MEEKTLLRSSNVENDEEKHHHELLRYYRRMKSEEVEPTMKRVIRSWRNHLTDGNSFLRQTLKDLRITPERQEESGKILGKDLWVRAHSKETPLNDYLKKENAPVELNGLNEITSSKELE